MTTQTESPAVEHRYNLDGRVLASGSGFEDSSIRVWNAATGRTLIRLDGHTSWVSHLEFSKDGRSLISAATDQTIRSWDTHSWTGTKVLRGHADEVYAASISQAGQLIASTSKDGNLVLWKQDGIGDVDGYRRLADQVEVKGLAPFTRAGLLLPPPGQSDEADHDYASRLHELGIASPAEVLGFFGTNTLCRWDGRQIIIDELSGEKLVERGALVPDSKTCPAVVVYHPGRRLLTWSDTPDSASIASASLSTPASHLQLKCDSTGLVPLGFSQDGKYLAAAVRKPDTLRAWDTLRVWNVDSAQIVASVDGVIRDATFAAGGRILVASVSQGVAHKIWFCDLAQPDRPPRLVSGQGDSFSVVASPDGELVASATTDGLVRLFDPLKGQLVELTRRGRGQPQQSRGRFRVPIAQAEAISNQGGSAVRCEARRDCRQAQLQPGLPRMVPSWTMPVPAAW